VVLPHAATLLGETAQNALVTGHTTNKKWRMKSSAAGPRFGRGRSDESVLFARDAAKNILEHLLVKVRKK
jgi:hypothetical protein